jgi:hypothetical protein
VRFSTGAAVILAVGDTQKENENYDVFIFLRHSLRLHRYLFLYIDCFSLSRRRFCLSCEVVQMAANPGEAISLNRSGAADDHLVAGLRHHQLTAPMVIDGPMDGELFLAWVEQFLRPHTAARRHRYPGQPQ